MGNHSAALQEARDEPDVEWLTYADAAKIDLEVDHRRNALRVQILSGDYDCIKACNEDFGCDYATDFFREIVGLIGADEPSPKTAETRYWLIRRAAEKYLSVYLEQAVDEGEVEREMRDDGLL